MISQILFWLSGSIAVPRWFVCLGTLAIFSYVCVVLLIGYLWATDKLVEKEPEKDCYTRDCSRSDTELLNSLDTLCEEETFIGNPAGFSFNHYETYPETYRGTCREAIRAMIAAKEKQDAP